MLSSLDLQFGRAPKWMSRTALALHTFSALWLGPVPAADPSRWSRKSSMACISATEQEHQNQPWPLAMALRSPDCFPANHHHLTVTFTRTAHRVHAAIASRHGGGQSELARTPSGIASDMPTLPTIDDRLAKPTPGACDLAGRPRAGYRKPPAIHSVQGFKRQF